MNKTIQIPNITHSLFEIHNDDAFIRSLGYITRIHNWITYAIMCQSVNIFGVCTNIINIICFVKQGFNDAVNISFLGLAIADLGSLLTFVYADLCLTPAFADLDTPFDPFETQYYIAAMPHTTFTRISSLITATITVERWLCIVIPFKVHQIVTPRKVAAITVTIFIVNIASGCPIFMIYKLGMKYFPERNKTMIGLIYNSGKEEVENISYIINNVIFPFCAFLIILFFTIALSINMFKTSKWRQSIGSKSVVPDSVAIRNQRAAKLVIMISILFIACFTPVSGVFLFMSLNPQYNLFSKYRDMVVLMTGVATLLESINLSTNIFIYYRMSSNYRTVFRTLFCYKLRQNKPL